MDIKELLKSIDSEILSEDSKAQIQQVFETVVSEKVNGIVTEKVQSALEQQDADHAVQLEKLLSVIDEDHSAKLTKLVQRLDEDHTAKLQDVVKHYEQTLSEDAKNLTESLSNDISNFLDLTIDELMPKDMLSEAVANTKAVEMVGKIKEIISFDPEFVNENIKEALIEGKQQIETLREDLNSVLKENVKLSTERSRFEAELLIEQKTAQLPTDKRAFIAESLKGKSADFIKDNFDYALKMFERKDKESRQAEKDVIINESVARTVDTPKNRSAEPASNSIMTEYVSGLK